MGDTPGTGLPYLDNSPGVRDANTKRTERKMEEYRRQNPKGLEELNSFLISEYEAMKRYQQEVEALLSKSKELLNAEDEKIDEFCRLIRSRANWINDRKCNCK